MAAVGTSKGELHYTLEGVAQDLRADGRGRLDYRQITQSIRRELCLMSS